MDSMKPQRENYMKFSLFFNIKQFIFKNFFLKALLHVQFIRALSGQQMVWKVIFSSLCTAGAVKRF